jgi:formylglycine-generating enzyme required for sulfatase activity
METNKMVFFLLVLLIAVLSGCAGSLPQQEMKSGDSAAPASTPAVVVQTSVIDQTAGMEFILVKGGCFSMGDSIGNGRPDERPVHEVCVPDYYIGKYEVTQGQWEKVMGKNPSGFNRCGPDCPVENVSWTMIQDFVRKLNTTSGKQYRLPTEAEWEYAARSGGKKEQWSGTDSEALLTDYAWFAKNSSEMTHKVGQKKPNSLGLHDMSGNVYEWCQDLYKEDYYATSPKNSPSGDSNGMLRAMRGGSWQDSEFDQRTAARGRDETDGSSNANGFRLLLPMK